MKFFRWLFKPISDFFKAINYPLLRKSLGEVIVLTTLSFLPLIVNIIIAAINLNNFSDAVATKIIPGEMIAFSLSFIAPVLYVIVKTHGTEYKLPYLNAIFVIALLIYLLTFTLYLTAKNGWTKAVDLQPHEVDIYFKLSLWCLCTTMVFRIYSVYHTRNSGDFVSKRNQQQNNFNQNFTQSLNQQGTV